MQDKDRNKKSCDVGETLDNQLKHHGDSVSKNEYHVLFCSLAVLDLRVGMATPWTYFLHLSLSSVILIDSSTGSPVHPGRAWSYSPACT